MSDIQGDRPEDQTPAVPPVPPVQPAAEAAAAQPTAAQPTAAQPTAAQPTAPTQPVPPAGYPTGAHAYARPQGYAGQPAPYPHSYAGQPAPGQPAQGSAFDVSPDAQPTLPIGGATGAVSTTTAPKRSATWRKTAPWRTSFPSGCFSPK